MKHYSRFLALMVLIAVLCAVIPVSSFAESRIEPLKYNKWYQLTKSQDAAIYKVTIKADTLLTVEWKNYNEKDGFAYGVFYTDKECKDELDIISGSFLGIDEPAHGNDFFILYPGTYYLRMYDSIATTKVTIKQKAVKSINKPNYSLSRAINLKANKKTEYAQTRNENYPRWYKIKLTKPQTISLYCKYNYYMALDYDLYDSNLNKIRTTNSDFGFITDGVQPKGTYYLVISNYLSSVLTTGRYCSFYWK